MRHYNPIYRLCRYGNRALRKHAVLTNRVADFSLGAGAMAIVLSLWPDALSRALTWLLLHL